MAADQEKEPKSERFNMFLSPSEMQEIDRWSWENRIRSKSEAVRRLCQIALALEKALPGFDDLARRMDWEEQTYVNDWKREISDPADYTPQQIYDRAWKHLEAQAHTTNRLMMYLSLLNSVVKGLKEGSDVGENTALLSKYLQDIEAIRDAQKPQPGPMEEFFDPRPQRAKP